MERATYEYTELEAITVSETKSIKVDGNDDFWENVLAQQASKLDTTQVFDYSNTEISF